MLAMTRLEVSAAGEAPKLPHQGTENTYINAVENEDIPRAIPSSSAAYITRTSIPRPCYRPSRKLGSSDSCSQFGRQN